MTPAVEAVGLRKTFGDFTAVDGVDFAVAPGEVFAFLGPNGAGKSTTIDIICTLSLPSGGCAFVAGHDVVREPRQVRRNLGLVFQDQTLDEQLSAEETLAFHAELYGVARRRRGERIARVLDLVGLADRRHDLVKRFSGGMARRLEIARALLHEPRVVVLDEPTVGLDPQTRSRIWQDIVRLRDEEGVTVFLTTHYLDEAEYADRIAIVDHGRLVVTDTPDALKRSVGPDIVQLETADDAAAVVSLTNAGVRAQVEAAGVVAHVKDGEREIARLIALVDVPVHAVRVRRPTLDDVFLHYTGHEIRDADEGRGNTAIHRYMASRSRR